MSSLPDPSRSDRPPLQLWKPPPPGEEDAEQGGSQRLSRNSTLRTFYNDWYRPVVLRGRGAEKNTELIYEDALRWWEALSLNPPICQIDEYTISKFQESLRNATYRRSLASEVRPLSVTTQHKILRQIRALLHRIGPTTDARRPAKALVSVAPAIVLSKPPKGRIKPIFTIAQAQKLVAAGELMDRPKLLGMTTAQFWQLLLAMLFYTGLRIGTVLALRWKMVSERDSASWKGWWLEVPGEITKTGAAVDIAVNPLLREAMEAARDTRGPESLIVPWPHCRRFLLTLHARLQVVAGLKGQAPLSLHAWRRTHADQLNRLGMKRGLMIAQAGLGHADASTTCESYTDLANDIRATAFPPLWQQPPKFNNPQRWLF